MDARLIQNSLCFLDFGRVIGCLSRLSRTPIALDTTHAFPPDSFRRSRPVHDDEDIYMPLENLADQKDIDDDEMEDVYECVTEMEEEEEEIYDRFLCGLCSEMSFFLPHII